MKLVVLVTALASVIGVTPTAKASIFVDISPGTAAPPGTLGGFAMGAFPTDSRPEGATVTTVVPPAGTSGNLMFDSAVDHLRVPSSWTTWSHGFSGDVYATSDSELLMALPANTLAFFLYVEPKIPSPFQFILDSGATVTTLTIDGQGGARYVGFYSDDPSDPLDFIFVKQPTMDSDGFAVGEFGIFSKPSSSTVPDGGGTLRLFAGAVAGLMVFWRKVSQPRHFPDRFPRENRC